jgi:hypothetical protein
MATWLRFCSVEGLTEYENKQGLMTWARFPAAKQRLELAGYEPNEQCLKSIAQSVSVGMADYQAADAIIATARAFDSGNVAVGHAISGLSHRQEMNYPEIKSRLISNMEIEEIMLTMFNPNSADEMGSTTEYKAEWLKVRPNIRWWDLRSALAIAYEEHWDTLLILWLVACGLMAVVYVLFVG